MVGCSLNKLHWEMCGRPLGWEEKEQICTHNQHDCHFGKNLHYEELSTDLLTWQQQVDGSLLGGRGIN